MPMTTHDVQGLLDRLLVQQADLGNQLEWLTLDINAVKRVLVLLNAEIENDASPMHMATTPASIAHCRTHMDAAVKMARSNGNILRVTPAGKMIKAAGLSNAKISSITATLHNRMSSSDDWEYIEPGTFLLVSRPDEYAITT